MRPEHGAKGPAAHPLRAMAMRLPAGTLAVPALASYGVAAGDIPGLVEKARAASSTKANPIALTREEMAEILARSL